MRIEPLLVKKKKKDTNGGSCVSISCRANAFSDSGVTIDDECDGDDQ